MARPIKDGVDYFPFDVTLDEKFELIEAEFGLTGFAVIVKLYQRIYSRGYYCEWTNEVALLFGRACGLGGNAVSEIVSACIRRGIFDDEMYKKYAILTSAGIQKRYFEAVSRRKNVNLEKRYLLVDYADFFKNADINWVNVDINPENDNDNSQRKVKKSKEKKTIYDICSAPKEECEAVFRLPTNVKGQFFDIFERDIEHWQELYPAADVRQELRSMLGWLEGNPTRRKTQGGMPRFITAWLSKEQNRSSVSRGGSSSMRSFDEEEFFEAAMIRTYGEDWNKV